MDFLVGLVHYSGAERGLGSGVEYYKLQNREREAVKEREGKLRGY